MHQCSGTIRLLREGRFADVKPIEEVEVDYPGIGSATAWTVGHPEAVTIPRSRDGLRECYNVMVAPRWLIDVVRAIAARIDAGELTAEQAAALLSGPAPDTAREPNESSGPRLPPLFAVARGTKDREPKSAGALVLAMPPGGMGGSTGVPLAVGLSLIAGGNVNRPGVSAPEEVIDPDTFFAALAPFCAPPRSGAKEMMLVTTTD